MEKLYGQQRLTGNMMMIMPDFQEIRKKDTIKT